MIARGSDCCMTINTKPENSPPKENIVLPFLGSTFLRINYVKPSGCE